MMKMMRSALVAKLLAAGVMAFAALATPASAQQALPLSGRTQGELRQGDGTLPSGEFVDDYTITGRAGQRVVIRMSSGAIDPYLIFSGPNNFQRDNDDLDGNTKDAVIDVTLPANGTYRVRATTYQAGERGAYTLAVGDGAGTPQQATAPAASPSASQTAAGTIAPGQSINGTLAQGDATLQSGEFQDTYRLQGRRGQQYTIRLRATAFDPYLLVRGPNNLSEDNDDDATERGTRNSRITVTMPADGELRITATAYQAGESGAYTISVDGAGGAVVASGNGAIGNAAQRPSGPVRPAVAIAVGGTTNGALAQGDSTLTSGEFYDAYTIQGRRGQALDIRLTSSAFDPYVMISGPNNFSEYNDDDAAGGASNKNSRLIVTLPADGAYRIVATSYQSGESGAYSLSLGAAAAGTAPRQAAPLVIGQTTNGALAAADEPGNNGAFQDRFRFQGRRGQRVAIDMQSGAFDTLVALEAPSGAREQNDDASQGVTNSLLETSLSEDGEYTVIATSYASGGVGAYSVTLRTLGADGARATAVSATSPAQAAGGVLTAGAAVSGRLQQGDATLQSGEFMDRFSFQGRRGQPVAIEMNSSEIDSYVIVNAPSGAQQDNDDAAQGSSNARVAWTLPEDGTYTVRATSYRAGEAGAYTLRMLGGAAAGPTTSGPSGPVASGRRGRVYAVMVGISNYQGTASNLSYTADDAIKMAETLRRQGVLADQSVVLTDAQATPANVRAAFQRVGAAAGPDDMFLFFYSGHGTQVPGRAGAGEPDNREEAIALIGGLLMDDEMAQMFRSVRAGVSILALDSCFSGGFARDVVSQPGVMGLFSSEEDLTSAVASKFEAGGYLSHFLRTGLGGEADENHNKTVTAGELSSYLRNQFATQAQGVDAETTDGQRNYQFLVVERGGVKIDDALLRLP